MPEEYNHYFYLRTMAKSFYKAASLTKDKKLRVLYTQYFEVYKIMAKEFNDRYKGFSKRVQ